MRSRACGALLVLTACATPSRASPGTSETDASPADSGESGSGQTVQDCANVGPTCVQGELCRCCGDNLVNTCPSSGQWGFEGTCAEGCNGSTSGFDNPGTASSSGGVAQILSSPGDSMAPDATDDGSLNSDGNSLDAPATDVSRE